MSEKVFVDGLMFQLPRENAPDFVKGKIIVHPKKFLEWAKLQAEYASPKGWLSIDMLKSQKGGIYFALDTWKPEKVEKPDRRPDARIAEGDEHISPDDIPF